MMQQKMFIKACHTLCPWNVPIQSPLAPFRSMGKPSLLALVRKYPSGVTGLRAQTLVKRQESISITVNKTIQNP